MKTIKFFYLIIIGWFILFSTPAKASNSRDEDFDWVENVKNLIYSPYYFGPSAFPIPELKTGKGLHRFEVEARGEYHYTKGDETSDFYTRALIPIVKGRAGIEVSFIVFEKYKTSTEIRDMRHAADVESPIAYNGDVVISSFFQLLENEKWFDAVARIGLKTASGGRVCDARFTDAATYWIDAIIGKDIVKLPNNSGFLRAQIMGGFYCWMTNDIGSRQNDALLYGGGLSGNYKFITVSSDFSGFHGYKNNGDRPLLWRNNLKLEYKKNILSLRYNHGVKDNIYNSYSVGYIRCF